MKSLIQGFLTGMRVQARVLAPRKVISPRFSRHLNSDTSIPHESPFLGMLNRHPGPACGRGGRCLVADLLSGLPIPLGGWRS